MFDSSNSDSSSRYCIFGVDIYHDVLIDHGILRLKRNNELKINRTGDHGTVL